VRSVTPEMLVERERLLHSPFVSQPPVQAAIALTLHRWPWAGASPAVPATRWQPRSRCCMRQAIWIC
jgi:phosphoribosyl-dephospho-CoA transferase